MRLRQSKWLLGVLAAALCVSSFFGATQTHAAQNQGDDAVRHVLLLSIDGFHTVDLARYITAYPDSSLAGLTETGVTYTNASTSKPSDSFPGLLSIITGGTPVSTGVWYDDAYDRKLSPPGSKCATTGTEVLYDESVDKDDKSIDGGGIDPAKLPLDPATGCTPVYPHSYLRVNTIFEVIKAAGMRTAWADKHPTYDIVNGPSGRGVDDLYTPEIALNKATSSVAKTEANDDLKVQAVLAEIKGKDHTGIQDVGVPAILGMNFQAVSVAQKLPVGGYTDSQGSPSAAIQEALAHTDQSIGSMVQALRTQNLLSSTLIIVTAKHGQSPIDPTKRQIVADGTIPDLINSVQPGLLAQATQDDASLIWLTDQTKTDAVVAKLTANQKQAGIQQILAGPSLQLLFNDPRTDSRMPDVIALPNLGVIYAGAKATKIAEHGGFSEPDTHVAMLFARPGMTKRIVESPVETMQIAPTILRQLGLDPNALQAVTIEQTQLLPGLGRADQVTSPSGAGALQARQTGTLAGNTGGSFAPFQIANPTTATLTLTLSLGRLNGPEAHQIGINVYQNGARLGTVTAQSTGLGDNTTNSTPTLTVTPSASGGPVLIQVFNYSPNVISYVLSRS